MLKYHFIAWFPDQFLLPNFDNLFDVELSYGSGKNIK